MKYSLGFLLQQDICKQLEEISKEAARIFAGQEIPVRWVKLENYRISLHQYQKLSPLQKPLLKKKLKNIATPASRISLHRIKLGDAKRMRGLIYLSIDEGGEYLRNLKSELVKELKIKETSVFVPNIVIGRVSKDLTRQEYSNILKDFESLQASVNRVQFLIDTMELIEAS
ncbi:hypothetical protein K8R20_01945 [bacterium]|nr:hypothetical protein [bacterium]